MKASWRLEKLACLAAGCQGYHSVKEPCGSVSGYLDRAISLGSTSRTSITWMASWDRHGGEYEHNVVQKRILFSFDRRAKEWRIWAVQEQRTRLGETRVRIPDVSVFPRDLPIGQVFTRPQLIAIEVLSPEDRHSRMDKKIRNYIDFGVRQIRVVDPAARIGWDCSDGNWVRGERFEVKGTAIYLSRAELFAELDEAEAE